MKDKMLALLIYMANRAKETSTWSGIAFLVGASASHIAFLMNPGECALIGGIASGVLKILFPDAKVQ